MNNEKIGVIVGKFLPLHNGHIYFINKSATQVEKLYIVVDEQPGLDEKVCLKAGIKYPDLVTRTKWLTSIYKDTPHIEVLGMSEKNTPETPSGWKAWSDKVKKIVGTNFTHIFTSDPEYTDAYNKYFKNITPVFYNGDRRETDGLSATKVRKNLFEYWHHLPSIVRNFYAKKIVIVGGESTGKSTLVKAMAKAFGTSWSEEYGRKFCETILGKYFDQNGMLLTTKDDYEKIVIGQLSQNEEAYRTADKFALIDTDAIYTQYFFQMQFNEKSDFIDQFISKEMKEFVYIYLSNDVPFIQDGFRLSKNNLDIKEYYKKYIGKFDYEISGKSYLERFETLYNILREESQFVNKAASINE